MNAAAAETLPPPAVSSTVPSPPPWTVARYELTAYGERVWIPADHVRCDACGGSGIQMVDDRFGEYRITCRGCFGMRHVSLEHLDTPEPDAVCQCGAHPVVAVVDGLNQCERCATAPLRVAR